MDRGWGAEVTLVTPNQASGMPTGPASYPFPSVRIVISDHSPSDFRCTSGARGFSPWSYDQGRIAFSEGRCWNALTPKVEEELSESGLQPESFSMENRN